MKKTVSVIMMFVLLFSFSLSALADDGINFDPSITNALNSSSIVPDSSWTATGYNRALATFLLMLDVCNADDSIDASKLEWINSYVGSTDMLLVVSIPYNNEKVLTIMYNPSSSLYSLLDWSFADNLSEVLLEKAYKDVGASFYKNSISDLIDVVEDLSEIING